MVGGESHVATAVIVTMPPMNTASRIASAFGVLLILGGLGFFTIFRTALTQEPDTSAILKTLLRLELGRARALAVDGDAHRLVVHNNTALHHHLSSQGWIWVDQLGAQITYRRNSQVMDTTCRQYSRFYLICDLNYRP